MDNKIVYIVHCIDTEGPLYESLQEKFVFLKELYGVEIAPTRSNLLKLQQSEIALDGKEHEIAETLSSHRINYKETWDQIDEMLERLKSADFRDRLPDSYGGGWVFNWHCMDHVGYDYNPRRRDIGYHNIFDHYREFIKNSPDGPDAIQWHFHPMSMYREANRNATSYINSPEIYQILCRKIIERRWFPTVFRAGFHVERPDSNWFLEQWIPFDISNLSVEKDLSETQSADHKMGRVNDWGLAPSDWSIYHPSHDYYQKPGNCRRWIARIQTILNRYASIDQGEMDKAFARAQTGQPTIVGLNSHDFRDLEPEVDHARELIAHASKKYPDVKFKYCEGIEAFRNTIWPEGIKDAPLELEIVYHPESADDVPSIEVITKQGKVFGPQPFLAIKTRSRRFIHDNFDFSSSLDRWFYAFYSNTLSIEDVEQIGVAANNQYGNVCVKVLDFTGISPKVSQRV